MKKQREVFAWIKTAIILIVALLFILPLIWMVLSSLKTTNEVFSNPFHWLPETFMWRNYRTVWMESTVNMLRSFWNSIQIAVYTTIGSLAIASMAAYAFAKIDFRGKNFIFMLFLSSMMIPIHVTIVPRFLVFKTIGLYDNLWAIILPGLFGTTAIFMLRQFYAGLPNDLMNAAKIDGAGHARIFIQIMLPLTKSALVSLVVLQIITSWNEYLSPLIFLADTNLYTVAQAIRWYMLDDAQRYELIMAAATSAIFPIILIFISSQKYFVEGIATAGLKG